MSGEDPHQIRLLPQAMTPLCDEAGAPRGFAPWKPVIDACSLCPARCCRMTVRCSVADVVRYCKVLDVPWQAGFRLVPGEGPQTFDVATADGVRAVEFALHQAPGGDCANLVEHHGYWRCGAYDARPTPCRLYPVSYDAATRKGGAGVLCLVPYGVTPEREAALKAEIARSIEGWTEHQRIADAWRAVVGPRTEAAMAQFVLTEAAKAFGADASRLLASDSPQERLRQQMLGAGVLR